MSYGSITGFAEKLNGVSYKGTTVKIDSVKMNNQIERMFNIAGDGSVIEHFMEGVEGEYFYIDAREVRKKAINAAKTSAERLAAEDVSEYMLIALRTKDNKYISDLNKVEEAHNILTKVAKQLKRGRMMLYFLSMMLLLPLIIAAILEPFIGAILVIIALLKFNTTIDLISATITGIKTGKMVKRGSTYTEDICELLDVEKIKPYLKENNFNI